MVAAPLFPCDWQYIEPDECCVNWSAADPEDQDKALAGAAWFLWAATARRFGLCQVTVLPCTLNCACTGGQCHSVRRFGGRPSFTATGKWYDADCGCSACRCCAPCEVWLPGPVADVLLVLVDGVAVPEDAYRVDDGLFLVRDDGECWPRCNDLGAPHRRPASSPGEPPADPAASGWSVTYARGEPVPYPGQIATAELACSLLTSCPHAPGEDCSCDRLPPGLTRLVRDGVTMEITAETVASMGGQLTGIASVDSWIKAVNPSGLTQQPRVLSPDAPEPRQVTWP
ncbi:MAG: hypothetical protein ACRDQD_08225 [Nocardioidaceae bacterium]